MSEFDDLFADDSQEAEGTEEATDVTASGEEGQQESFFEKLKKEKGYKSEEDVAKAYVNADGHIKKLEQENQHYRDWIQNKAAAAVKLAKEYIDTDEYRKKYGGQTQPQQEGQTQAKPGAKGKQAQQESPEDMQSKIQEAVQKTVGPQMQQISGHVNQMTESSLLKDMKESKDKFPYLTEEVEKDMKAFLKESKQRGVPYPANPSAMVNLYHSFVGKNVSKIMDRYKDKTRQEVLQDLAEGRDSITESDRAGEGGAAANDETTEDIMAMFKSYEKPLSFGRD